MLDEIHIQQKVYGTHATASNLRVYSMHWLYLHLLKIGR